jgi:hypothetical protein
MSEGTGGEQPLSEVDLEPGLLDDLQGDRVGEVAVIHRAEVTVTRHRAEHRVAAQVSPLNPAPSPPLETASTIGS